MRAVLAALVLFASTPVRADDGSEPEYEGKPLKYWVQRFRKAETAQQRYEAAEAIKAFKADAAPAIPALSKMLSDRAPQFRNEVIEILGALGPVAKDARPALLKFFREHGGELSADKIAAFIAIHPTARDAVASLIPFLDEPGFNPVYLALCKMGPDAKAALPAIRRYVLKELAAQEKDETKAPWGLYYLPQLGPVVVPLLVEMLDAHGGCGRRAALGCLEQLGSTALRAAPGLVKVLTCDDAEARYRAAVLLWKLEKNPAVVPALAGLLKAKATINPGAIRSTEEVQANFAADAAKLLGEIGPSAKEALPALREAVVIGIPASALQGVYFHLAKNPDGYIYIPNNKEYELSLRYSALVTVAQAAQEAIDKIEGKAKK
jgi:HEAT repeat protein